MTVSIYGEGFVHVAPFFTEGDELKFMARGFDLGALPIFHCVPSFL
jgi:hypothetical protein